MNGLLPSVVSYLLVCWVLTQRAEFCKMCSSNWKKLLTHPWTLSSRRVPLLAWGHRYGYSSAFKGFGGWLKTERSDRLLLVPSGFEKGVLCPHGNNIQPCNTSVNSTHGLRTFWSSPVLATWSDAQTTMLLVDVSSWGGGWSLGEEPLSRPTLGWSAQTPHTHPKWNIYYNLVVRQCNKWIKAATEKTFDKV